MVFLDALTKVTGEYRLDVYGDGNDLKKAQAFSRKNHLKVVFHGATPFSKIYPEIIKSHLDVLVSYNYDTFGMTLVEAESAGTPALFVDPDLREVTPASGTILTATPDSEGIAISINDLIAHPGRIERMSSVMLESRDSVRVSKIMDKLEKYIADLLK